MCLTLLCPGHWGNNIPLLLFQLPVEYYTAPSAVALRRLFRSHYQPLPSAGTHLYPCVKRSNYSKASCSRTQVSLPGLEPIVSTTRTTRPWHSIGPKLIAIYHEFHITLNFVSYKGSMNFQFNSIYIYFHKTFPQYNSNTYKYIQMKTKWINKLAENAWRQSPK